MKYILLCALLCGCAADIGYANHDCNNFGNCAGRTIEITRRF